MANSAKNCYLGINGKKYGPLSEQEIRNLYADNKITNNAKFIRTGMKEWILLAQSGIINDSNNPESSILEYNTGSKPQKKKGKRRLPIFVGVLLLFMGIAWGVHDGVELLKKTRNNFDNTSIQETFNATDGTSSLNKADDQNVKAESVFESDIIDMVKNGTLLQYPSTIVGEAMEAFVGGLKWEGGNDNGRYYVNASGKVTLMGKLTDVLVQYEVFMDSWTFVYNAIMLDGMEQAEYFYRDFEYNMMNTYLYGRDTFENRLILAVKSGQLYGYEGVVLGFAIESFVGNPVWAAGDITENGYYSVIVRGIIKYMGDDANVVIRYNVDPDTDTFEYYAMEINDVPQPLGVYLGFIELVMGY